MGPIKPLTRLRFKGKCTICGFPLVRVFPEDFPKEWKFCCNCHYIAKMLTTGSVDEKIWGVFRVKKIKRKINLVRWDGRQI